MDISSIVWAARVQHLSPLAPSEVMELIEADALVDSATPGFIALPAYEPPVNEFGGVEYVAHVNVAHISSVVPCTDGERRAKGVRASWLRGS